MPTVETYTVSTTAQAPRTCSKCDHQWGYTDEVIGHSSETTVFFPAHGLEEDAKTALNKEIRTFSEKNKRKDILCPQCNRLSLEVIREHCPQGFVSGLISLYQTAQKQTFTNLIISGPMAIVLGIPYIAGKGPDALLLFIPGAIMGLYSLLLLTTIINRWKKNVTGYIQKLSETEAENILTNAIIEKDSSFLNIFTVDDFNEQIVSRYIVNKISSENS